MPTLKVLISEPRQCDWEAKQSQTFSRSQVAVMMNISRTTLWSYENEIVKKARILDYARYTRLRPYRLDWYCIWILSQAAKHKAGEGTYETASTVMRQQRKAYSREVFNYYQELTLSQKVKHA